MDKEKEYRIVDRAFNITLFYKMIFAIVEVISGLVMIFITPERLVALIEEVTEIHFVASHSTMLSYLNTFAQNFNVNAQWLTVIYLLSHGLIKVIVLIFLYKRVKKAYPISIVILIIFIIVQLYEFIFKHSVFLLFATFVDLLMIVLTVMEYRHIKEKW